jgi:hypothetical protein
LNSNDEEFNVLFTNTELDQMINLNKSRKTESPKKREREQELTNIMEESKVIVNQPSRLSIDMKDFEDLNYEINEKKPFENNISINKSVLN